MAAFCKSRLCLYQVQNIISMLWDIYKYILIGILLEMCIFLFLIYYNNYLNNTIVSLHWNMQLLLSTGKLVKNKNKFLIKNILSNDNFA